MAQVWFQDVGKAKAAMTVMGVLLALSIATVGVLAGIQLHKQISWSQVRGVVTARDTTDKTSTWTEIEYEEGGEARTLRQAGSPYWMDPGVGVDLLVNPSSPEQAEVAYDNPYIRSMIYLAGGGICGVFFLFYLVNCLALRGRGKRDAAGRGFAAGGQGPGSRQATAALPPLAGVGRLIWLRARRCGTPPRGLFGHGGAAPGRPRATAREGPVYAATGNKPRP